jgi:peptide/nickel transport system substrate-binding protein
MKNKMWKPLTAMVVLAMLVFTLASCATPTPEVIEKIVTQIVKETIKETVIVEGTPQVIEKEVTKVVEKEVTTIVEKVVTATPKPEPVTLRIATTYIWDTANPTFGWYNYGLRYLLYDTLIEWTEVDLFEPNLAESWSASDDGLVWTFNIREGVTFHDGTPCTAEEIAWNLNWAQEMEIETYSFYLYNFEEVVALDPTTLQITLSEPVGNMEYLLVFVWILPPSVWQDMTYDEIMEFEDIAAGMGTGPYKLVDWTEGESLILEANENYWRGAPAVDRVIWQEYATEDAMVQALLAGEVDVVSSVPSTAIQTLQGTENIQVLNMPTLTIEELIINSHENGTQPESLNDLAVRLAIEYAVDKQQIVDVAYLGYGEPATVVIPPGMGDFYNSEVKAIPFDPDEGNRILDEAGYLDTDGDAIREDADGNPLEYRLYAEDTATYARVLEIISDGLLEIGISAPPTVMDEDSLIGLYPDFDFDLIYWGWGLDPDPDFAMLIFTCDERAEGGWNDSGYCDEEFDEMYFEQAVTVDHQARRQLIWDMQAKLYEERPYIMAVYLPNIQAYRSDRFTGFGLDAARSQGTDSITWKWAFLQAEPVQ